MSHHTSQKIAPSTGGSAPPSNTWFLGPTRVTNQMASQSVQPCLQGSGTLPTDQPTDSLSLVVMRPKN